MTATVHDARIYRPDVEGVLDAMKGFASHDPADLFGGAQAAVTGILAHYERPGKEGRKLLKPAECQGIMNAFLLGYLCFAELLGVDRRVAAIALAAMIECEPPLRPQAA
jgi:hypothetical protein